MPTAHLPPNVDPPEGPLVDSFGRIADDLRISVTDRCNLRCVYCMPPDGLPWLDRSDLLTYEEIRRLAALFVRLGIRTIRLTGGEPLVRRDLPRLVGQLASLSPRPELALTTNGVLLDQQAEALATAGLDRVNVSLDSLQGDRFEAVTRRPQLERVLAGIAAARSAGLTPVKVNCVVMRGRNDDEIADFARFARDEGCVVRFIEYMDVGTINHWQRNDCVPSRELLAMIGARWPLTAVQPNYHGEVAERYQFDDGAGEVGFISSVSEPFCGSCTRARLSSDGQLFTCLFASRGTDLKNPMRAGATDDELRALVSGVWGAREDRYSELRASQRKDDKDGKVEMYYIGG